MRATLFLALLTLSAFADELPTFADFRRIDRTRRLTGQLQSKELLEVSQISRDLILRTVQQHPKDLKVAWGAAELLLDWPQRRALFESVLAAESNNWPVALRFACAAARQGDGDLALKWARHCQAGEEDNLGAWLVELSVLAQRKEPLKFAKEPPLWASQFRDYSVEATRARIQLLERAGYSAYAARRLGFKPDSDLLLMARDLCKPPLEEVTKRLLKEAGTALQRRHQFFLSELVGQTLERSVLAQRTDAETSAEVRMRGLEIDKRREELKELLADVERNVVDFATEKEMVQYFDDVLELGEAEAMQKLTATVRRTGAGN